VVLTYRIDDDVGLLKLEQRPTVNIIPGTCQIIEPTGKVSLFANERAAVQYIHTEYRKNNRMFAYVTRSDHSRVGDGLDEVGDPALRSDADSRNHPVKTRRTGTTGRVSPTNIIAQSY
jgi:hypothetical protein